MTLLIIVLLILALLLIVAELFVVGGFLGGLGALLICTAAALSFYHFDSVELAAVVLIGSFALAAIILIFGFRIIRGTRAGRQLFLADTNPTRDGFESADRTLEQYRGKSGVSVSELHPSGLVEIDGERITVTTEGEFVEEGVPVEVVDIRYNQAVVRPKTE